MRSRGVEGGRAGAARSHARDGDGTCPRESEQSGFARNLGLIAGRLGLELCQHAQVRLGLGLRRRRAGRSVWRADEDSADTAGHERTSRFGLRLTGRRTTRSKGSSGPALALRLKTALSSSISSSSSGVCVAAIVVVARVILGLGAYTPPEEVPVEPAPAEIAEGAVVSLELPLRLLRPLAELDSSCIDESPSLNSLRARKGGGVF